MRRDGPRNFIPDTNNLPWFCFWSTFLCCGCLPILGLLVGAVLCLPVALLWFVCNTAVAIATLPRTLYYTYYTLLTTQRLGPNIKVAGALSLWLPVLLWPPIVALCSLLAGFVFGLFAPVFFTFDNHGYFFWETTEEMVKCAWKAVKKFFTVCWHDFFLTLSEWRIAYDGTVFDIAFHRLLLGLLLSFYGFFFIGPVAAVITLLKCIPALCRCFHTVWRMYADADLTAQVFFFLPFLLANLVLPFCWAVVVVVFLLGGFFCGLYLAWPAYVFGCMAAVRSACRFVYRYDLFSNELLFNSKYSCLACWNFKQAIHLP
eukprot:TRINITY_DN47_c0_g1_i7.p1 TRINITY_DN47_c0_g1~~TRINITY_DN47_c0_g1_i7.p1  ORF type:complete len:316 (+),score=98.28 TRINITY_DN47_c0_g1_i7:118-1065(+)